MRSTSSRISALLAASLSALVGASHAQASIGEWRFNVFLDGKPIGHHEFIVERRGDETEIRSQARFQVEVLLIPVYRYKHEDREIWRDGCLTRIDARTSDNGKELVVRGTQQGSQFAVSGPSGAAVLPACVQTFAYWDAEFLKASHLLNSQTGEYSAVQITSVGRETLTTGGRQREADRHTLHARDFHIDLWYSPEGEWLALESLTPQGRRLRYEIR